MISTASSPLLPLPTSRQAPLRTVFREGPLEIGTLRLRADHPEFPTSGPRTAAWLAFPRTSWALERPGQMPLFVDPTQVLLIPAGMAVFRRSLGPQGERCDWFALGESLLARESLPWPAGPVVAPLPPALGLRARCLVRRLLRHEARARHEVRQEALEICRGVFGVMPVRADAATFHSREHRELAFAARTQIVRSFRQPLPVLRLARELHTSPFHLCRVFRAATGTTLHRYQTALRLAASLDLLPLAAGALTDVGLELGFSSHSHFTASFRRAYGVTPSAAREQLGCARLDSKAIRGALERHSRSVTKR